MATETIKKSATCAQVLMELRALGTEQTIKTYRNHGITGALLGISYAHFKALDKRIADDQDLAEDLWATGIHDARVMACWKADVERVTVKVLNAWVKDVDNVATAFEYAALAADTSLGAERSRKWRVMKNEWRCAIGWSFQVLYRDPLAGAAGFNLSDAVRLTFRP